MDEFRVEDRYAGLEQLGMIEEIDADALYDPELSYDDTEDVERYRKKCERLNSHVSLI